MAKVVIVGATKTGKSIHNFLNFLKIPHSIVDTREEINFEIRSSDSFLKSVLFGKESVMQAIEEADELYFTPGFNRSNIQIPSKKIKSELNLLLSYTKSFSIGITGTNGKSTVCYLLSQLLNILNIPNRIIGNFGEPMLNSFFESSTNEVLIIELSSFQLQDSSYSSFSENLGLDISIFTNFSADHLDQHSTISEYLDSKRGIQKKLKKQGVYLFNKLDNQTYPLLEEVNSCRSINSEDFNFNIVKESTEFVFRDTVIGISNKRFSKANLDNILFALAAIYEVVTRKKVSAPWPINLDSLKFLEFRMEVVRSDSILIVNDSKSTNPHSTYAAIKEFRRSHDRFILILGGDSKGLKFDESLLDLDVNSQCLIYGKDAERIHQQINHSSKRLFDNLEEVVKEIKLQKLTEATILFSPGCSSKDQFLDYVDRGRKFNNLLRDSGLI
ncbi:MAG: UDP-N-acetylmuramoyl-L-alanine--D-glutamate ligase [Gammaproteobacteria bacterium]